MKINRGLYIHIPFCSHLCSYCDFTKMFYNEEFAKKYLQALKKEMEESEIHDVCSIYVGGGTPSSLNEEQLEELLKMIEPYANKGISYAFEANFENLTEGKIKLLKKYGVNRISLGVQTFNEEILKYLNRYHSKKQVFDTIALLKENGIDDINIDLIYGLPNQTMEILKNDLDIATSLPITHISTYSLMVNEHTKLYLDGVKELDQDRVREMYDYIVSYLKGKGFNRYEVSNFAKASYESKHNLIYWHNQEYWGIGLGASSYLNGVRFTNTKSLTHYLKGERVLEREILSKDDIEFYRIMLGLRLKEGIEINSSDKQDKINSLVERGLLEKVDNKIKVTDENLFILDYVLRELL